MEISGRWRWCTVRKQWRKLPTFESTRFESTRPARVNKPVHCVGEEVLPERGMDELVAALQQEVTRIGDRPAPQTGLAAPGIRLPYIKGLFEAQDLKATRMLELLQRLVEGLKADRGPVPERVERRPLEGRPEAVRGAPARFDAGQGPRACWECQGEGHFRRDCPKRVKRLAALEQLMEAVQGLRDEEAAEE